MFSGPLCLKGTTETTYDMFENMFSGPYFFKTNTRNNRNNLRFVCFPAGNVLTEGFSGLFVYASGVGCLDVLVKTIMYVVFHESNCFPTSCSNLHFFNFNMSGRQNQETTTDHNCSGRPRQNETPV